MQIIHTIQQAVSDAVATLYGETSDAGKVQVNATPADFTGDYTVVIFPFVKIAKKGPEAAGNEIGAYLLERIAEIKGFNVVKGFLNLELSDAYWNQFLDSVVSAGDAYGRQPKNGRRVMLEYSSPNTNKPLHLGHVRNCLLGWSCSKILEAVGYDVVKTQIINDRGVAICKSMLAWQKFGEGKTPENSGIKGDHLVGDFYVLFEQKSKAEYEVWQQSAEGQALYQEKKKAEQTEKEFFSAYKNQWFNLHSKLGAEVRDMLLQWEAGDPATIALWRQMNGWVYEGFNATYDRLGVTFDKLYYESDTYLLGKEIVDEGLNKGVFYRKDDGSVWIDLTDAGHDHKVLLRSDGTSVYVTQDMGTARMRYHDFACEKVVYVVADEQNYHFSVLFETLKRLGESYADGLYHLSYGLVELPNGRMKAREGTVVDADDLMDEVIAEARKESESRGEIASLPKEDQDAIIRQVGMAAMKFYIIKVNPRKRMIFNPEESVELQGQTGPFVQYPYVRIRGLQRKMADEGIQTSQAQAYEGIQPAEKELLKALHEFPETVLTAAKEYDPSHIANYCYALAKSYNRFWHEHRVLQAESVPARDFRLQLSQATGSVLKSGMALIGIEMPERM